MNAEQWRRRDNKSKVFVKNVDGLSKESNYVHIVINTLGLMKHLHVFRCQVLQVQSFTKEKKKKKRNKENL